MIINTCTRYQAGRGLCVVDFGTSESIFFLHMFTRSPSSLSQADSQEVGGSRTSENVASFNCLNGEKGSCISGRINVIVRRKNERPKTLQHRRKEKEVILSSPVNVWIK